MEIAVAEQNNDENKAFKMSIRLVIELKSKYNTWFCNPRQPFQMKRNFHVLFFKKDVLWAKLSLFIFSIKMPFLKIKMILKIFRLL